jgi:cutinase
MKKANLFGALMAAGVAVIGATAAAPTALAADGACADVEMVFARGTFEAPGVGVTGQAFVDAVQARTGNRSVDVYGVNYPASLDFGAAADGVVDASNRVRDVAARCPNSKIVVGGYSQGAAVAAYITEDTMPEGYNLPPDLTEPMPPEVAKHVAAVVLFGKPSSGFMQLIYSGAPPITVGPRYTGKTLELCIPNDPVCAPGGGDREAHSEYIAQGLTDQAADYVAGKLGIKSGAPKPVAPIDQAAAPIEPAPPAEPADDAPQG